ncbi:MAG: hypothetical protein M5R40_13725 [Anaerolineae bacterium]|nr:hypothetical protein [Anaerolineae bacterium]
MTDTGSYPATGYEDEGWEEEPSRRPSPPKRRRRRPGCLSTLIFLVVVVGLVALALFLPPFSLFDRLTGMLNYTALDAANPSISDPSGFALSVDINSPGEGFGVRVGALDPSDIVSGRAGAEWEAAYTAIPAHLTLQSPIYTVATRGAPPATVQLSVPAPARVDGAAVDLFTWQDGRWVFVPARMNVEGTALTAQLNEVPESVAAFEARPLPPVLSTVLEPQDVLTAQAELSLNMLFPSGLTPLGDGQLAGAFAPGFQQGGNYRVLPVVRNFTDPAILDVMTVADILRDDATREAHITALRGFAAADNYDGVAIDYRGLPPDYRGAYTYFVTELARRLHADGRWLVVFLQPAVEDGPGWNTGAYDWRALGRAADAVVLSLPPDPTAYGAEGLVQRMLRWAVDEIDRYKIMADLTSLSLRQAGSAFTPVPYQVAFDPLGGVTLLSETEDEGYFLPGSTVQVGLSSAPTASGEDPATGAAYVEYSSGERTWVTSASVLRARLDSLYDFNLGGVNVTNLLNRGNLGDMVNVAVEFQNSIAPIGSSHPLALRWTVRAASGETVAQAVAGLSTPFVWTAEEEGDYIVAADLEGQVAGDRGEVRVAVAVPTPTPTPEPTATPTPAPVVPSGGGGGGSAGGGSNAAPVAPAGSMSVGSFELGGHVDGYPPVAEMQQAGMRWVKYQLRYALGQDPGSAAGLISAAQGAGFKVLLGIVGYPGEMASVGLDSYIPQFASFVGGVAALGPNAIEVWNEPNIDREWPNGQISGENYTRLLAAAYNAIKGANGSVMVISGALAPTGFAAPPGTSAAVWNDDVFYQSMANAGAANYMDCIGAHYNEGIVPPDWTSGDPRGGYPTYYLTSMINRAWAPFGGSRPVCITELGYLSPEGYGGLPAGFTWAADTSVAEQAAWLAGAAVIAANSGQVRLMIIWNVNFSRYDSDPMAGFAMIRPGGTCPACQALAGVR